jgi:two-component system sensor histidine kinase RegB
VRINLRWLLRLRWGAAAGQAVTIVAVHLAGLMRLSLVTLLGVVALELASNVAAAAWLRRAPHVGEASVALVLTLDVAFLTVLLDQSGGPFNPFCFLYLVHIALAAVILDARTTWAIAGLSVACLGALFLREGMNEAMDHATHMQRMSAHMEGMWVAMVVAAGFIVYFVTRVRRALTIREAELSEAKDFSMRRERLASLAALAAGAAHELATPLSSIAVAAKELARRMEAEGRDPDDLEDARLIRQEVSRCRLILDQMAATSGQSPGEAPQHVPLATLLAEACDGIPGKERIDLQIGDGLGSLDLFLPRRSVAQAFRAALKNGVEASPEGARVVARVERRADARLAVEISDRGAGMPDDVRGRVGEPFFTTKGPGAGMGLGLFLARAVVELLGGTLTIVSRPGEGTRLTFELPVAPPAKSSAP